MLVPPLDLLRRPVGRRLLFTGIEATGAPLRRRVTHQPNALRPVRQKGDQAQRVGMARALGLAMLADKLSAEKAAEWGLIWQVVDDAELASTIEALAAKLAAMPTKALVRTRQAMHAAPMHTLEQQLSMEGGFMRELGWSPDYAEGVAAFMEKRAPEFTGE